MVKVFSCGQMAQNTQAISSITTSKAKEFMNGLTAECMRVNGKTTKCMEKESLLGEMEGDMKVTILMIRKKVLACLNGLMVENTLASGEMASSTGRELL